MDGADERKPASDRPGPATGDARPVEGTDDLAMLPDRSADDSDTGWGDVPRDRGGRGENDERLLADRPPHWGDS